VAPLLDSTIAGSGRRQRRGGEARVTRNLFDLSRLFGEGFPTVDLVLHRRNKEGVRRGLLGGRMKGRRGRSLKHIYEAGGTERPQMKNWEESWVEPRNIDNGRHVKG